MLTIDSARNRLLALVEAPLPAEMCPLATLADRVIAEPLVAARPQPPFPASAMDGYAVRYADLRPQVRLDVIGQSAAGHGFAGQVGSGQAVRIFTGAPVPDGADTVMVQEDTTTNGAYVVLSGDGPPHPGAHIRPAGNDFAAGQTLLDAGTRISARHLGLIAAAGRTELPVRRQPTVALLATGDELVPPGVAPGPYQIISSNGVMIGQLCARDGGQVRDMGIIADRNDALDAALAAWQHADVLVTIGGASVGDHDLVRPALLRAGANIDFWKIAMKPGKPMMAGTRGRQIILGLPGNPVSAFVCASLFLVPLLRRLQGMLDTGPQHLSGRLDMQLPGGGRRTEYLRATVRWQAGEAWLTPLPVQDSGMLSALGRANALLRCEADSPTCPAGARVSWLPLD